MKQHATKLINGACILEDGPASDGVKKNENAAVKGSEDELLWVDLEGTEEELTQYLRDRHIPAFLRHRVLSAQFPAVFSGSDYLLVSVSGRQTWDQKKAVSITFLLFQHEVITLSPEDGYSFAEDRTQLSTGEVAGLDSAPELFAYLLDSLVEKNICLYIDARSRTETLSMQVDNAGRRISERVILDIRRQVNHLVNQFEDCFYGLADLQSLTPHPMLSDAARERLRDIRDAQNHLAKSTLRLVTRLTELLQHCQFLLQQQTDQRVRQLTVLSAIFMPLTLITGIYGMNFIDMPITHWKYGYYATLTIMVGLAVFLWATLKRKGWFQ